MKKVPILILGLLLGSLLTAQAAQAQDLAALQRCRATPEAGARLACYDAIKLPPVAPAKVAPTAVPAVALTPAVVPPAAAAPAVAAAVADNTPVVPLAGVAAEAPASSGAAQFGLEGRNGPAELAQIESQLLGEFEGWEPRTIFRLANGQVWQVNDDSNASYSLRSPKVTIRRGVFGAFYLEVDGAKRSPRVKRLR
jgi:lipoprotein-anchoring transpeptidase ErfK/SrfK